jgi:hypothetical protein
MTDARGRITRWVYGANGDPTCEILPPSTATTCTADPSDTVNYVENSNGQLANVTMPPNNDSVSRGTTYYTYYADGLVKDVSSPAFGVTIVTKYSDLSYDALACARQ